MSEQRLLVLPPNWLGDAVMALPAIRDLRRQFGDAELVIAARPSVAALFKAVPGINRIITLGSGDADKALTGDIGVLFPNSFRSAWLLKRAGVRERWGYSADFRGWLLTKAVRRPRRRVHFGEYYQTLVRELGCQNGPLVPQLDVPAAKVDAAATLLTQAGWRHTGPLVAIAPGAAFGHAKRWPSDRFGAVANAVAEEFGGQCVILGRAEDRDASHGIKGIDLIGRTDLLMLMGVLAHCRALVANDSGALHLAAALGVPVTAIYGPTDERYSLPLAGGRARPADPEPDASLGEKTGQPAVNALFEPVFCRPCGLRDCPIDHRCMRRISPARVIDSLRIQLPRETERSI